MNTLNKILALIIIVFFSSCSEFLDTYPNGDISGEELWEYQNMTQGLVGQCYDYMSQNYNNDEGAFLDCATDDAVMTSTGGALRRLAVGTLSTDQDPFHTYWERDYQAIHSVNMFLEDNKGFKSRLLIDEHLDSLVRHRLQGEAFALRAWFEWDLLQKFGGKGKQSGTMLGFPIVLDPLDLSEGINLERNTYDDCVKQILDDCDSAYKYLPIAHRDFLVTDPVDLTYAGARCWGRMDGITTRAIKALVYMTWASPRFNPQANKARWDSAAKYAKQVIDFKLTVDNVPSGFVAKTGVTWTNPNFPGIVFASRYLNANDAMERLFYPGGFQGNGRMGATQELVNAFPTATGYPINDPANRGGYNAQDPYANRDPRFYSIIFHNNAQAVKLGTSNVMYTFENFEGGKDAPGMNSSNSRTNYHIKKFVFMGLNWSETSVNRQPHSKFFIRWAHMCLTFAEAANNVAGPTTPLYGLTAKDAIKYLRSRNTYDNKTGLATDPYLDEIAAAGQTQFAEFIKNERRIETCFEGLRFFDLRRWTTDLTDLNKAVHGASITKNPDDSFTYNLNVEVEPRIYKSAYLPIPYSEILKMSNLEQNEGWDGWN